MIDLDMLRKIKERAYEAGVKTMVWDSAVVDCHDDYVSICDFQHDLFLPYTVREDVEIPDVEQESVPVSNEAPFAEPLKFFIMLSNGLVFKERYGTVDDAVEALEDKVKGGKQNGYVVVEVVVPIESATRLNLQDDDDA